MQRQIQFVYGMKGKYNQVPVPFILPNQVDIFTTIGYFAPSIEDKSKLTELHSDLYSQLENYKELKNFKMFGIKGRGDAGYSDLRN